MTLTSTRFLIVSLLATLIGSTAQAQTSPATTSAQGAPAASCSVPLTLNGIWQADDGSTYVFRQIGNQVWGLGKSKDGQSWTTVFNGIRKGPQVTGNWSDMTGTRRSNGALTFQAGRQYGFADFKRVSGTGKFSSTRWIATCNDVPNVPLP